MKMLQRLLPAIGLIFLSLPLSAASSPANEPASTASVSTTPAITVENIIRLFPLQFVKQTGKTNL